jgi:ribonucleoside-diphosphate reductase alpha chain
MRKELPKQRRSRTYEFKIADLKGYFTVGEFEDGTPGELFITVAKQGSTLSGVMDAFGRAVSYGLQYGVPLKAYARGMINLMFAPSGITDDDDIKMATSVMDYIFKRLSRDYLGFDDRLELGLASIDDIDLSAQTSLLEDEPAVAPTTAAATEEPVVTQKVEQPKVKDKMDTVMDPNAPLCTVCGNRTQRSGSCYVCTACGSTTGCS